VVLYLDGLSCLPHLSDPSSMVISVGTFIVNSSSPVSFFFSNLLLHIRPW
jgi:hypothetical protein